MCVAANGTPPIRRTNKASRHCSRPNAETFMIHAYLSTACLHKLHKECRRQCKFCDAKCDCPCHAVEQEPQEPQKPDFDYTAGGRVLAMTAKKTVTVVRPFRDRDGKDHKPGDKIQVDPDYGVELGNRGDTKDEGEASQLPAEPPKSQPK